jgi:hypothetical protein
MLRFCKHRHGNVPMVVAFLQRLAGTYSALVENVEQVSPPTWIR